MHRDQPERMRAITATAWGAADLLAEVEVDTPAPGPTEVLVRVHAAGVSPTDWKQRATGGLRLWSDPPILVYDVSGTVVSVGLGVDLSSPGDQVFGMPRFPFQAAAALPLASLIAWQVLVDTADVQEGQRVLIHGAAGGVGHLAVQIAKTRGAHVIGTARAKNHELLRSLGADELVDYAERPFDEAVADVDVVLDTIGGDYPARSLDALCRGGVLVCPASPFDPPAAVLETATRRGIRTSSPLVEPDRLALTAIVDLVTGSPASRDRRGTAARPGAARTRARRDRSHTRQDCVAGDQTRVGREPGDDPAVAGLANRRTTAVDPSQLCLPIPRVSGTRRRAIPSVSESSRGSRARPRNEKLVAQWRTSRFSSAAAA